MENIQKIIQVEHGQGTHYGYSIMEKFIMQDITDTDSFETIELQTQEFIILRDVDMQT